MKVLTAEIDDLRRRRIDISGLRIAANAHLIMPYHQLLDQEGEAKLGKLQIGTTRRGIGPCYADKASARDPRAGPTRREDPAQEDLRCDGAQADDAASYAKLPELDLHTMTEEYRILGHRLEPFIADTAPIAWRVLDEEAWWCSKGTLLDIDHGTYPFVTSSNTVAGGVRRGRRRASLDRRGLGDRKGVHHARGRRSFPTELDDELGERIRDAGGEFGTTTGRAPGGPAGSTWSRSVTPHGSTGSPGSWSPSWTC